MKTKSGFEFEINESALDDFELFDLLAQADDGNGMAIPKVLRKMFDKETVKRLYDHLRTEKGNVPLQAITKLSRHEKNFFVLISHRAFGILQ